MFVDEFFDTLFQHFCVVSNCGSALMQYPVLYCVDLRYVVLYCAMCRVSLHMHCICVAFKMFRTASRTTVTHVTAYVSRYKTPIGSTYDISSLYTASLQHHLLHKSNRHYWVQDSYIHESSSEVHLHMLLSMLAKNSMLTNCRSL